MINGPLTPGQTKIVHQALLNLAREAKKIEFIWQECETPGLYCPACGGAEHGKECIFGFSLMVLVDHLPADFWMTPRSDKQ